jgi:hypothetical protein
MEKRGRGVGLRVRVGGAALPRDVVLARRLEATKELGRCHRAERRRVTEGPARARRSTPSLARVPWTSPCRAAPLTPSADRRLPSSVPGSRRAELRSSDRRWRQVSDFPRDSKAGEGVGLRVRVGGAALPRDVVLARRLEASKELAELRRGPPAREGPPPPSRGCRGPPPVGPPLGLRPPADRPAAAAAPAEPTDVGAKYRTFRVIQKRGRGWGFVCGWEEPLCRGTSFSRGGSRHRRSSGAVIARNDAELRRGPPAREGPPPPSRGCRGPPPVGPPR